MRYFAMIAAVFALVGAPAAAECNSGSADILTLENPVVTVDSSRSIQGSKVSFSVRNNGDKAIRLVDASVHFEDVLGGRIASIAVARDLLIAAGEVAVDGGSYLGTSLDRIPNMNPADVVSYICTKAVVYENGESERF